MFCVVTFSHFLSCFTLMLIVVIMTLYQVMIYKHCFDYDLVFIYFKFLQWGGCAVWDWCFIFGLFVLRDFLCFNVRLSLTVSCNLTWMISHIQNGYYGTFPWGKVARTWGYHSSDFSGGMKNTLSSASTLTYVFIMGFLGIGKILFFHCDTNLGIFLSHSFTYYLSNVMELSPCWTADSW
jgi:hypothetical protein